MVAVRLPKRTMLVKAASSVTSQVKATVAVLPGSLDVGPKDHAVGQWVPLATPRAKTAGTGGAATVGVARKSIPLPQAASQPVTAAAMALDEDLTRQSRRQVLMA